MDEKIVDKFKKRLEKLKSEILFIIEGEEEQEKTREVADGIDQATKMIEEQMGSMLSTNFKTNLGKVEEALKKIKNGGFGKCTECGDEISIKRLDVLPLAQHCIKCQTELENLEEDYE